MLAYEHVKRAAIAIIVGVLGLRMTVVVIKRDDGERFVFSDPGNRVYR